jgi:hypothetical protein
MKSIFRSLLILSTLCGALLHAEDKSSGCGPGWYVLKDNSIVSSALRAITNSILFPISTLGITFGTSNCTQHKIVRTEKQSLHFATMNYFELQQEMAQGHGEYLSGFAQTLGCQASSQRTLGQALKSRYSELVPAQGVLPEKLLLEVYKTILTHPELMRKCSLEAV